MSRLKAFLVAAVMAVGLLAGSVTPASARHTCGLEEVDPTVNAICDYGPHDPKGVLGYIVCWLSPTC